jgi:phosphatidylinositol-3-phosphatase
MLKKAAITGLFVTALASAGFAQEGPVPKGVPHLDHVFVIVMENHGYGQVIGNPNEPYLNGLIVGHKANLATNYFAIGHPSSTNYLEIVGGSNFGVRSDNSPDWGNATCTPNLLSGKANVDNNLGNSFTPPQPPPIPAESTNVCPITPIIGMDTETPAVDNWNEVTPGSANFLADIDGVKSVPAASAIGMTIADQLREAGRSWRSYQESLPNYSSVQGQPPAYGVNYADGYFTDATNPPPSSYAGGLVKLYAAKHDPFVYFASVQNNKEQLANVVPFSGANGLYADLGTGDVPTFSFIVPNQCNDQHGRGNAGAGCDFDPSDDGGTAGLNPALINIGDQTLNTIVNAIHNSSAWEKGRNAIVVVWDENDYSGVANQLPPNTLFPAKNQNHVVLTVELNKGELGVKSSTPYTSFSLLKSLEAGLHLPCLNHACNSNVAVMSDLFGRENE